MRYAEARDAVSRSALASRRNAMQELTNVSEFTRQVVDAASKINPVYRKLVVPDGFTK
jgi:hypothetical protein